MSKHEERALKLHARLTAAMHMHGGRGPRKHSVAEVDRLSVTVDPKGGISVFFAYSDGSTTTIDFEPGANAYDMAREAKRHAVGHCSEIREALDVEKAAADRQADRERERAARAKAFEGRVAELKPGGVVTFAPGDGAEYGHAEVVTEEQAADYNTESAALKGRISEALLQHRAAERSVEEVDGRRGVHVKCAGCDFGSFSPYREDQAAVAAFLDKARTADFPADDLDRAFAEHQADVVARLI